MKVRTLGAVSSFGSELTASATTRFRSSGERSSSPTPIWPAITGHASVHCVSRNVTSTTLPCSSSLRVTLPECSRREKLGKRMPSGGALPRKSASDVPQPPTAMDASIRHARRLLINDLPRRAGVVRAVQLAVEADDVGPLGIARRPRDRPGAFGDLLNLVPRSAAVGAAEDAAAGCQDRVALPRPRGYSDHLLLEDDAPRPAVVVAREDATPFCGEKAAARGHRQPVHGGSDPVRHLLEDVAAVLRPIEAFSGDGRIENASVPKSRVSREPVYVQAGKPVRPDVLPVGSRIGRSLEDLMARDPDRALGDRNEIHGVVSLEARERPPAAAVHRL